MVDIAQNLVDKSMYNYKVISESIGRKWKYIVVHNTANDASAANEVSYMRSNKNYTSFHYAVDDKQIVQGLPDNVGAFDTNNRSGSHYGLSIEICYSKSGGERFTQAEKNAAEFIASKLKEMGYHADESHIVTHKSLSLSNKYCPERTLNLGWTRFINMVKNYMKEEDEMTESQVREIVLKMEEERQKQAASDYANEYWNKATQDGMLDGNMPRSPLTREQYATIQYRVKYEKCPSWARDAVQWAIDTGIIKGDGKESPNPDNVRPMDKVTRAEMSVMLEAFYLLFNEDE